MKKKLVALLVMLAVVCWTAGAMAVTLPASIDEIPMANKPQTAPIFAIETVGDHYEVSVRWDCETVWNNVELRDSHWTAIALQYDKGQGLYKSEGMFEDESEIIFRVNNFTLSGLTEMRWPIRGTDTKSANFYLQDNRYNGASAEFLIYWDEDDTISKYTYYLSFSKEEISSIAAYYGPDGQITGYRIMFKNEDNNYIELYYDAQGNMTDAVYYYENDYNSAYYYNEELGWGTLEWPGYVTGSIPIDMNDYPWGIAGDDSEWCAMDFVPVELNDYQFEVDIGFGTSN